MGLIILLVVLIIMLVVFRSFRSFLYTFAAADILFRVVHFINSQINVAEVNNVLNKVPTSIETMINSQSSGTLNLILLWVYVALYLLFLSYIIPTIFKFRRK